MEDFLWIAATLKLGYALTALVATVWVSRWLDARAKRKFSDMLIRIEVDALALAVYYGLRWLGICLLVGWVIS